MLEEVGFVDVKIGPRCDTFGEASGEKKARQFEVYGYPFTLEGFGKQQRDNIVLTTGFTAPINATTIRTATHA